MALTPEQLALRRTKITATDAAKVCGVYPWGGPLDVQLEKEGKAADVDSDRMKWGNILEDPIRRDFAKRRGIKIAVPGTLVHPLEEWAAATPDGILYPGGTRITHGSLFSHGPENVAPIGGHEIKTHTTWQAHRYGEPGTDEVPPWELVQCAWNQWIASAVFTAGDFEVWDLTAFMDNLPQDYRVTRDPELEEMLIATCRAFWDEHVIGGVPVAPDGTQSYTDHQANRWPRNTSEDYVEAAGEVLEAVQALHATRTEIAGLEREESRLVQIVKEAIGDRAGLEFPAITGGGKRQRITWKRSKDSTTTSWADVVASYRQDILILADELQIDPDSGKRLVEALDAAIKTHTRPKPGSRRFNVPRNWNS